MPVGPLAHQYRMRMYNPEGGGAGGSGSESPNGEGDPNNTNDKTYSQVDIDNINKALEDERKLRRDAEKASKDNAKRLKDLEDASKPDLERLTGERDDLNSKYTKALEDLRDAKAQGVVAKAARDAKAISPNAVYAMIARDLDYDDDNQPTNVAALIAQVQKDEPDMFREIVNGSADGGAGHGDSATSDDMNSIIREMAGR